MLNWIRENCFWRISSSNHRWFLLEHFTCGIYICFGSIEICLQKACWMFLLSRIEFFLFCLDLSRFYVSWFSHHLKQGTTKINVAVDKLPQFHCCKINRAEAGPQHTATIHIGFERYASVCIRINCRNLVIVFPFLLTAIPVWRKLFQLVKMLVMAYHHTGLWWRWQFLLQWTIPYLHLVWHSFSYLFR